MNALSRRNAIKFGALGGLGVIVGGIGLSQTGLPWRGPGTDGIPLIEPELLQSRDGVLQVELIASRREVLLAGRRVQALTYSDTIPGKTWRVRPGDQIAIRLQNDLDTPTNLHTHGLAVSPEDNGDNPFLSIEPGQSFDYRLVLPKDHPPGVAWYHPHRHGTVTDQLFGGLYGALIVDGDEVPSSRERVLVVSDISLTEGGTVASVTAPEVMMGREGKLLLVNGQQQPLIAARAGERERWRVVNACTSRYLRFALPGQHLELLGMDMSHEPTPREVTEVFLAPGNRADLLVTMRAGTSEVRTLGYDRGGMGMMGRGLSGPDTLATLTVAAGTATTLAPVPHRQAARDLRNQPIATRRQIAFTMGMGSMMGSGQNMMDLGFDGRIFDADRIDQLVDAGTVEEWLITNPTPMDHPFHLHVWPMQLIETVEHPVNEPEWRDVVNVPAGSQVRVLVDFARNPGRSVYHCHILDHEDSGMMAVVDVRP